MDKEGAVESSGTSAHGARMPVVFVGHGSPMNAIVDNRWSQGFRALGASLPRPRAALCISAHWWIEGSFLTGNPRPRTIHDFGGFPQELFAVEYPAPGAPDLAKQVATVLDRAEPPGPDLRNDWGLDHGTWSVTRHLWPEADVPIVQLSLDARLQAAQHLELAKALHQLRGDGVMVMGSGNIVHNLRDALSRRENAATPNWAAEFDSDVTKAIEDRDDTHLVRMWPGTRGREAHPHPDHWFPLLYAVAATDGEDRVSFPIEGFDWGSLSMRSVVWS